jgi:hypothetical protein
LALLLGSDGDRQGQPINDAVKRAQDNSSWCREGPWRQSQRRVRAHQARTSSARPHTILIRRGGRRPWNLDAFVRLARTIRRYRASIEATIEWRLTNGIAESNNASIGRLRANARGFHKPEAFITMTLLDRAGIAPDLPWTNAT